MDETPRFRWYRLTPDRLILGLLVVECLLWLSDRFQWPTWHKGYAVLIAVAAASTFLLAVLIRFVAALTLQWRFRLSIRSPLLLVLVIVVALPFTWLAIALTKARAQKEAVKAILDVAGWTCADWQVDDSPLPLPNAEPPEPRWLRNLLGPEFFDTVVRVYLSHPRVTDASLDALRDLSQLKWLDVEHSHITDVGL